jgi:hypothetical protein
MRAVALVLAAIAVSTPARGEPALKHTRLLEVELTAASASEGLPVRRGVGWAFVPFGVGQFANDQPVKGTLFCVSEVALFLTAGTALGVFEASKVNGGFMQGGDFRDTGQAKVLEVVYLAAFWAGVALMAVGIVDALVVNIAAPSVNMTLGVGPGAAVVRF